MYILRTRKNTEVSPITYGKSRIDDSNNESKTGSAKYGSICLTGSNSGKINQTEIKFGRNIYNIQFSMVYEQGEKQWYIDVPHMAAEVFF